MRRTSFGRMSKLELPYASLAPDCEVMQFMTNGKPHDHDIDEVAICVSGSGVVVVGEKRVAVKAGEWVMIPAFTPHHMEPAAGVISTVVVRSPGVC